MKKSQLKQIIREEIQKVLREETKQKGNWLYLSDYNEFIAKLEQLWGKKKSEWTVMKGKTTVSPTTKFTEKDVVSYSIDNLNIGEWDPSRPQTQSKLPAGAVNTDTKSSYSDLIYPEDSWRD
jgi:hypothetical protein